MDFIKIEELEIYAKHGVLSAENQLGQKFLVTALMYMDTTKAGLNDSLDYSIDYASVCNFITEYMQAHTFKLIEAAAENLANDLLLSYPIIQKVDLEIKKPWAPIGLPLKTVSVNISRGWHTTYIALGSNLGDKEEFLNNAITEINSDTMCQVAKVSDFIITKPYGFKEQDDFINAVIKVETLYSPMMLLDFLQKIELDANRVRTIHWGPRTLDLDIILYDDLVIDEENLTIPHSDMANRSFVLIPLNQIAPNTIHPVLGKSIRELLLSLPPEN
ncbi:MAG: 2-amino-4-hydroxy-6-hydroxymethyldihydropteridine diphosphokinase [Lachnospiraceae bacterium]|nr:2-amino-4-hydroxy-6-hydroxymethyldihydropteridine diphosphokinase [Lachnospiraceae bacterium]